MLEELLANMTFSPVLIAVCAAIALVCLWLGWTVKGFGARRREKSLQRHILEAKAAIPQLETASRSQDAKVARLEEENKEYNRQSTELAREISEKDRVVRSAERRVRNLTSELAAVKGARSESGNEIVDGFEVDESSEAQTADDSPLLAKLKKTEELYDKLKDALITRDDKIQSLEAKLEMSQPLESNSSTNSESAASTAFEEQIRDQQNDIEELKTKLQEVHQEKDMLADMAKRRSESNKSLKEASNAAQSQLPKLEKDIQERDKTISDRENSIKRYLNEFEIAKEEKAQREATIADLNIQVNAHNNELTSRDDRISTLGAEIAESEERITALVTEVSGIRTEFEDAQGILRQREETIAEQQSFVATSSVQLEEHLQTNKTMHSAIKDRDFKIETLTQDITDIQICLDKAETQASDAFDVFEKRKAMLVTEKTNSQQSNEAMNRKAEDLTTRLAQSERWLSQTKETLDDRETQLLVLETKIADFQSQNETLAMELEQASQSRQSAEADTRANNRQLTKHEASARRSASQLKEQEQTIVVFKSTVSELEIKTTALSEEVASLREQLETSTPATPHAIGKAR